MLAALFLPLLLASSPGITVGGSQQIQGPITVFGQIYSSALSVLSKVFSETTSNITLYVRADGNDNNTCFVDSAAGACLTIQSAINRFPKRFSHLLTINIGAGSFAPFSIMGFSQIGLPATSKILIQGTLGNPTLTTGTVSGTATGGGIRQCVDAGQNWTVNELRGKWLKVGSEYRVVRNNTINTINLAGPYVATCSGKVYELFESKTVITNSGASYIDLRFNFIPSYQSFELRNLKTTNGSYGIFNGYTVGGPSFVRVAIFTPTTIGIVLQDCDGVCGNTTDVYVEGAGSASYGGLTMLRVDRVREIHLMYVYGGSGYGYYISGVTYANMGEIYADNNGTEGLYAEYSQFIDIDAGSFSYNGRFGVVADSNNLGNRFTGTTINMEGTIDVSNNTLGGIALRNNSRLAMTAVTGASNGGFGVLCEQGSSAFLTSATTLTGSSGDLSVNAGVTALPWATYFASDGDIVVNVTNGCRVERKD